MRRALFIATMLALPCACEREPAPPAAAPAAPPAASMIVRGDSCKDDIPDCEAACAMREAGRTRSVEWFDRRCAAVILGRNPDKAVAAAPVEAPDAGSDSAPAPRKPTADCEPPYRIEADGFKRWKRECIE